MEAIDATLDVLPAYWDALDYDGQYLVLVGGAGSGKSWFLAQKHVLRCLANPDERILLIRKVYKTCHGSVYQQVKDVMYAGGTGISAQFRIRPRIVFFHPGSMMVRSDGRPRQANIYRRFHRLRLVRSGVHQGGGVD